MQVWSLSCSHYDICIILKRGSRGRERTRVGEFERLGVSATSGAPHHTAIAALGPSNLLSWGTRRRRLHLWGACNPGCAATREKTQSCAAEPEACWSPPLPPPLRASCYHPWGARLPWRGAVSACPGGELTLLAGGSGRLGTGRTTAGAVCGAAGAPENMRG